MYFSHLLPNLLRRLATLFGMASVLLTAALAETPVDYAPLKTGIEWIMNAEIISPAKVKTTATAHRTINELVDKDGKSYHRSRTWIEGGPFPYDTFELVRKDTTGFYSLKENENAKEETEMLFPLKVGTSWEKLLGPLKIKQTVIALEDVSISGKVYENCFHIRSTASDGSFTEDYFNAPGFGTIKSDLAYANGASIRFTLREFKQGKP